MRKTGEHNANFIYGYMGYGKKMECLEKISPKLKAFDQQP
jgi:hypothetical protein